MAGSGSSAWDGELPIGSHAKAFSMSPRARKISTGVVSGQQGRGRPGSAGEEDAAKLGRASRALMAAKIDLMMSDELVDPTCRQATQDLPGRLWERVAADAGSAAQHHTGRASHWGAGGV